MLKRLSEIQTKLDVPKDRLNKFGGYNYRSGEDILNALKELLKPDEAILLTDEVVYIEGRFYVRARATFVKGESEKSVDGWAREAESQKGMNESQITGSASSYARKYALAGLFAIEDSNDPDSFDNTTQKEPRQTDDDGKPWLNKPELDKAKVTLDSGEVTMDQILEKYKVSKANMEFLKSTEVVDEPV